MRRLIRISELYKNPELLIQRYEQWFDHLAHFPVERHWLCAPVEAAERLFPLGDWERAKDAIMEHRKFKLRFPWVR